MHQSGTVAEGKSRGDQVTEVDMESGCENGVRACVYVSVIMFSWIISVYLFICLSICCLRAVRLYFCLCFSVPLQDSYKVVDEFA